MALWHAAKFRSAFNRNREQLLQSGLELPDPPQHTTVPEVWHLNPIVRWYRRARNALFPFTLRDLRKEELLNPELQDLGIDEDYSPPLTPTSYDSFGSEASEEPLTPPPDTVIFGLRVDAENWTPSFNASHPIPSDSSSSLYWSSDSLFLSSSLSSLRDTSVSLGWSLYGLLSLNSFSSGAATQGSRTSLELLLDFSVKDGY